MYGQRYSKPMKYLIKSLVISLIFAVLPASAQTSSELIIDAADQDLNYKEKTLYFSGSVTVVQGNLSISADELFVETNDDGTSSKLIAKGSPAKFEQKGENNQQISSQANEIIYLVEQKILKLEGKAVFKQGASEVISDSVEFDLQAQRVKASGDKEQGGRVTTRLKVKN